MVRIRRSPTHPMLDIHHRMEQVMERLLRDVKPVEPQTAWVPRADVYETADGFVVTLELPGVEREEIEILVEGLYLRLSGARPEPPTRECMRWHQMEIAHGRFERVIALPQEADSEGITATYKDGFLVIQIPRGSSGVRSVPIDEP
jgi:HSP20 family protein